ncbi:hypothetical protein BCR33DRAFT_716180 [Rhizoclosmatium globosum]|uniref:Uncharacterized protein n=1 Tax=Rhizoclosmatium globosum TaxID=329046 RepID=A0A1Y2CGP8_9FUNG|nr:hypothetical protein BCR33DRAFT_716180 [Rhizoclosmatium globosum]|eukprot:ORY45495.1 hypothetical protein BCR33DRAFT_716180 [Rhizoclosmatium globosum]
MNVSVPEDPALLKFIEAHQEAEALLGYFWLTLFASLCLLFVILAALIWVLSSFIWWMFGNVTYNTFHVLVMIWSVYRGLPVVQSVVPFLEQWMKLKPLIYVALSILGLSALVGLHFRILKDEKIVNYAVIAQGTFVIVFEFFITAVYLRCLFNSDNSLNTVRLKILSAYGIALPSSILP